MLCLSILGTQINKDYMKCQQQIPQVPIIVAVCGLDQHHLRHERTFPKKGSLACELRYVSRHWEHLMPQASWL